MIKKKNYQKKTTHLTDSNLIYRMLFTDSYTNSYISFPHLSFLFAQHRSVSCLIDEYDDDDDENDKKHRYV